jgi:uncharacterized membrane protein
MSGHTMLIWLRLIHIVAGTFWVGSAVMLAGFVAPAIRAAGPAGAPVMRHLTAVKKFPYVLLISGLASLVSGGCLTWVVSGGSVARWVQTGTGATYASGAIAALVAAVIGIAINIPTAIRLGNLATAQMDAARNDLGLLLARRLALGTHAVAFLLLIAVSAMAVARYVP